MDSTSPSYPPCLKAVPADEKIGLLQIFNVQRLVDASAALLPMAPKILSEYLYGEPIGKTTAGLEARLAKLRREKKNIGLEASIANRQNVSQLNPKASPRILTIIYFDTFKLLPGYCRIIDTNQELPKQWYKDSVFYRPKSNFDHTSICRLSSL
jgi:hypothetical protein